MLRRAPKTRSFPPRALYPTISLVMARTWVHFLRASRGSSDLRSGKTAHPANDRSHQLRLLASAAAWILMGEPIAFTSGEEKQHDKSDE